MGRAGFSRGSGLGEEVDAFLQGTYAERLRARGEIGQTVPWTWLNAVAHAPLARVTELAADAPTEPSREGHGWAEARSTIAKYVLQCCETDETELRRLQRDVLVPMEIRLGKDLAMSPWQLTGQVLVALHDAQH